MRTHALRLRLVYFMRRLLFVALTAGLLSPTAAIADTYDALCNDNNCQITINESGLAGPQGLIAKERITQWAKSIKDISHLAYKTGGFTVSKSFAEKNKANGEPRKSYRHAVFMRHKYECLNCKSRIERKWYGKRKLDFCPSCQIQRGKIKPSR